MDMQFSARPLVSFPGFWLFIAGVCLIPALYYGFLAYKIVRGGKNLYPNEAFFLLLVRIFQGKEMRNKLKQNTLKARSTRKYKGFSAIAASVGFTLLAIFFLIASLVMSNIK